MSIAHTQQLQCPTLTQDDQVREVPYLPCVRCPNGLSINLAFVAEWSRIDGNLVLVMTYSSLSADVAKRFPARMITMPSGPFADWVEDLLDAIVLDGPDTW